MGSSLVACLSWKIPGPEKSLLVFSPHSLPNSKNPADRKLAVVVGLAPYYLRHRCDQSPGYKVKEEELAAWAFPTALKWPLCLPFDLI